MLFKLLDDMKLVLLEDNYYSYINKYNNSGISFNKF